MVDTPKPRSKTIEEHENRINAAVAHEVAHGRHQNVMCDKEEAYSLLMADIDAIESLRNCVLTPVIQDLDDKDNCLMTVEEFMTACDQGGFIDYDGFGALVVRDPDQRGGIIRPSLRHLIPPHITHILWFNR